MAVHLTRIYTRTGDDGTTGLADFSRVPKTDPRLVAYADTEEANAALGAALLHVARTVTRRAERSAWALLDVDAEHANVLTAKYLNRLSDLLFILGRRANPDGDVLWRPGENG